MTCAYTCNKKRQTVSNYYNIANSTENIVTAAADNRFNS